MMCNPGNHSAPAIREEVRREVLLAGFDRVGFARAGPSPHSGHFHEWLARGYGGTMAYLSRTFRRRVDPREVLPGARTVMVMALHYGTPGESSRSCRSAGEARSLAETGRGEISRYARGTDYHRVLEARLKKLCQNLQKRHVPHRFRYYVDTGPVLERAWAERAGIGWIGKNCCAIDPQGGSYFFIGVILTTLEFLPDRPSTDHCGSCTLCMDACPTGAIVEPHRIDARRCISYLNIENRGSIPHEFREPMAGLIFGCDICQEVCPFNRPDRFEGDPELAEREQNNRPALADLASLSPQEFSGRFPRSAVRRARAAGFLRNVLVAMGNSGRAIPDDLRDQLNRRDDIRENPVLRETLQWASRCNGR